MLQRWVMLYLNKSVGTWNMRRIAPRLSSRILWDAPEGASYETKMCPMLIFAARVDGMLQSKMKAIEVKTKNKFMIYRLRQTVI